MHIGMGPGKCEMGGCKCPHHKLVPVLIILIGLVFLLGAVNYLSPSVVAVTWPILLILIGLQKLLGDMCGCCGRKG